MSKPKNLILLVNPAEYNDRAFVLHKSAHWERLQERGWKPLGDLDAKSRKEIADFYKSDNHTPEVLEAHLWEAAQPKRREAPPATPYVPSYQGRPPKKEAKKE